MTQENHSQNGHEEDGQQQVSGYRAGPQVPSIHDLAMMGEMSGQGVSFNLPKEFLTGSTRPEEYLPRGVYTPRDIARRKRLVARDYRVRQQVGCNIPGTIWVGDQMTPALGGRARKEAIKALEAMAHIRSNGYDDVQRGLMDRLRRPMQGQNG